MDMNNSGSTSGKVVSYPDNLVKPRGYEAPSVDNAQSRGIINKVFELSQEQTFNNMSQGKGVSGPAEWGSTSESNGSKSSAEAGTKVGSGYSVDFSSGQNSAWNCGMPKKD